MSRYAHFLRAINVAGHKLIKMLREALGSELVVPRDHLNPAIVGQASVLTLFRFNRSGVLS